MENTTLINEMKEINVKLNKAAKVYYSDGNEIMTNFEYDTMYDRLVEIEKLTGIVLADSRTQNVGFEVVSSLTKVKHPSKMLSLDKTKSREELASWLGGQEGFLSWKLDGLTIVLTYDNGQLTSAVTRGDGVVGEDIIHNAKHVNGIPHKITDTRHLVVRGEALMHYEDFDKVNETLDVDSKYKNPRNLCAGTVRQLDSKATADRNIQFYAFRLVTDVDIIKYNSQLDYLKHLGFQTVAGEIVNSSTVINAVEHFEQTITNNKFPSDGLVLIYNDTLYGNSLGETSHHPRNSIAFKWKDETECTEIVDIEWSASRTGSLNPVAIFNPVEIDGTTVTRASVHNVSIFKSFKFGKNDTINVFKANMIIPQVLSNDTKSNTFEIPSVCPICGGKTEVRVSDEGIETLYCTNSECPAKLTGKFEHYVDRDAMNIVGLSTATIDTFINHNIIANLNDIYTISEHKNTIINLDGFGIKSYDKIVEAINNSRTTDLYRFIYAIGINSVGVSVAKTLEKTFKTLDNFLNATMLQLINIDGIGNVMATDIFNYINNVANRNEIVELATNLTFNDTVEIKSNNSVTGKTFVVTGSVNIWKNRKELTNDIEKFGGKVGSGVSAKTDFLVNNDANSNSSKNKKAKELNIPIITEQELFDMLNK